MGPWFPVVSTWKTNDFNKQLVMLKNEHTLSFLHCATLFTFTFTDCRWERIRVRGFSISIQWWNSNWHTHLRTSGNIRAGWVCPGREWKRNENVQRSTDSIVSHAPHPNLFFAMRSTRLWPAPLFLSTPLDAGRQLIFLSGKRNAGQAEFLVWIEERCTGQKERDAGPWKSVAASSGGGWLYG